MDMPFPDRGTLGGLRAYLPVADGAATPAALAFMGLDAALAAHAAALGYLDRAEARFIAARRGGGADQPARINVAPRTDDVAHGAAEGLRCYIHAMAPDRLLRQRGLGSRGEVPHRPRSGRASLIGRNHGAADRLPSISTHPRRFVLGGLF